MKSKFYKKPIFNVIVCEFFCKHLLSCRLKYYTWAASNFPKAVHFLIIKKECRKVQRKPQTYDPFVPL